MTSLKWKRDPATGDVVFKGRITMAGIAGLDFSATDRALMRMEINRASDFLLTAERIFRVAEEHAQKRNDRAREAEAKMTFAGPLPAND